MLHHRAAIWPVSCFMCSEAASYEFTTLTAIPGTMNFRGARIQVVDLPGIIEGARDGKGRGRQVISAAKTCNMLLIVLDAAKVHRKHLALVFTST
jgi:small GTP-binding protein